MSSLSDSWCYFFEFLKKIGHNEGVISNGVDVKLLNLALFILLVSCAGLKNEPKSSTDSINNGEKSVEISFEIKNYDVFPGKVRKLIVPKYAALKNSKLVCGDEEVVLLEDMASNQQLIGYFTLDYKYLENNKAGPIKCTYSYEVLNKKRNETLFTLNVLPFDYPASFIKVDKKHVDLSPEDLKRFLGEKEILKKVYANAVKDKRLFAKKFERPLKSAITGVYGSRRVFNNKKDSWHSGTDFRARTPIPIPSANEGIVAFAGELFFNGNTVIVDHGQGILTMYCHLSKINVKEKDQVDHKTILGLSGNTGRSSAPHLHWGVKVNDNWIDGLQFLEEQ